MNSANQMEVNDELIIKYLSGEASPEEAIAIDDWREDPVNRVHFESLSSVWNASHPGKQLTPTTRHDSWTQVDDQISTGYHAAGSATISRYALRIAASLLIVVAVGIGLLVKFSPETTDTLVVTTSDSIKNFVLPDLSSITLHHETTIQYPAKFAEASREVTMLSGEAYFAVAHDSNRPFIIHHEIANIRVVGTEFNVKASNQNIEVSVNSGKVLVFTAYDSALLETGMIAVVSNHEKSFEIKNDANVNTWGYATGKFVFSDTPVGEVISSVEKAYPCRISVVDPSIRNCKLTAVFDNDSAENIVNLLAESLNLSVKRDGTRFILEGDGCP